jgi:hydroxyacylglutathione hydrolase
MRNRLSVLLPALLLASPTLVHAVSGNAALASHRWIHGAEDCSTNQDPSIETYKFDEDTYVLRQNKCVDYEAPFIYVLFGSHTVLIQDTGAIEDAASFPLYETVRGLVEKRQADQSPPLRILVIHSHSHGDHKAADAQFRGMPHVTLIEPNHAGLKGFLDSDKSGAGETIVDLGGRQLTIFPIPGHQAESIAHTKWLLTGDTVYPGIISVLDWDEYRSSVVKLVQFAAAHDVSAVLGSHIEMSNTPSVVYERGTTFQPAEASLILPVEILHELSVGLAKAQGKRREVVTDTVIVKSVPLPARVLIRFLKMLGVR